MLYIGVVENRFDPLKLGRCQVRIIGLHTHDKIEFPTNDLPWAYPMQPIVSAAISGIGQTPLGPVEGSWVIVMFQDEYQQYPIIIGTIGGIAQQNMEVNTENEALVIKIAGELQETNGFQNNVISSSQERLKRAPELSISSNATLLAKKYLIEIDPNAETFVQNNVRALITQSMFDALVVLVSNVGQEKVLSSSVLSTINASKYKDTAAAILIIGIDDSKRQDEKDLFLKDGIPSESGDIPASASSQQNDNVNNSQTPQESSQSQNTDGFKDPNGKYPLYINEPDTNRLARHEEIQKTIVYKKETAVIKNVPMPEGISSWDQSPIPYNAQYPFNHVTQYESGHVVEFDDSPNSERIHIYHKSGTFSEIDSNGTRVNRIVGDNYEILERNGYVYVKGALNCTVEGTHNIRVTNSMNVDVDGVVNLNVYNDVNMKVSGSLNMSVAEDMKLKSKALYIESENINVYSSGAVNIQSSDETNILSGSNLNMQASGETNILSGGDVAIDGAQIYLATGAGSASSAEQSGLSDPSGKRSPSNPEFPELFVTTRGSESAYNYETPDEGDPTEYINKQVETGAIKKEEMDSGTQQEAAKPPPPPQTAPIESCDAINKLSSFDASLKLSTNFTLGDMTKKGSRPVIDQLGVTKQQIVCNLKGLCETCLEPVYKLYPNLIITSAFRRPGDAAGSSTTSAHNFGEAVDIVIPNLDRQGHYQAIQKIQQLIPYDQLLLEYSGPKTVWIHIAFKYSGMRKQIFTMRDHKRISSFGEFVLVA